jgi:hypothetical protein
VPIEAELYAIKRVEALRPRRRQTRNFGYERYSFRHGEPEGKAMTEVVIALFVFFSFSVFLAHAFDAYRVR